jgi:hypothetical protein
MKSSKLKIKTQSNHVKHSEGISQKTFIVYQYLILGLVCIAIHGHTLTFEFTQLDDSTIIGQQQQFLSDLRNIPKAFTLNALIRKTDCDLYRPLQTISYIIDYQLGKANAFPYHFTNLLIYCLTCLMVLLLLRMIFRGSSGFVLTAIAVLFSINPFLVPSVAWVPARGDLLLAFFGVFSIINLLKFYNANNPVYFAYHIISFIFALFSKETAVVLPFLFLITGYFYKQKPISFRYFLPFTMMWIACVGLFLWVRAIVIGDTAALNQHAYQIINNLQCIPDMLAKFILPVQLSPIPTFNVFFSLFGSIIILTFVVFIIIKKHNRFPLILGLSWYIVLNLPSMAYTNISGGYDYLNHRGLLPLIGIIIILTGLIPTKVKYNKTFLISFSMILVFFVIKDVKFARTYSNPWEFSSAAIKTNPHSALGYSIMALMESDRDVRAALSYYNAALSIYPYDKFDLTNRANILGELNDTAKAFEDFATLIQLFPTDAKPCLDRGKWRLVAGNLAEAEKDFENAIKLDTTYSDAYNNLGTVYLLRQDTIKAEKYYLKAISYNAYHADALFNYGLIRLWRNDHSGACEAWKRAAPVGSKQAEESLVNYCK